MVSFIGYLTIQPLFTLLGAPPDMIPLIASYMNILYAGVPFVVVGMNSITIYLACRIVNFELISNFFFGGVAKLVDAPLKPVLLTAGVILLEWLFLYFLYRKKIFLRV